MLHAFCKTCQAAWPAGSAQVEQPFGQADPYLAAFGVNGDDEITRSRYQNFAPAGLADAEEDVLRRVVNIGQSAYEAVIGVGVDNLEALEFIPGEVALVAVGKLFGEVHVAARKLLCLFL